MICSRMAVTCKHASGSQCASHTGPLYCALDPALCHQSGSWYNWRLEERMQWPCRLSDLFLWWHYFLCLLFLGVVVCCLIPPTFVASIAWRHCMLLLAVMCALWCERRATRHCCTSECGTHDDPDSAASHLTVNVSMWLQSCEFLPCSTPRDKARTMPHALSIFCNPAWKPQAMMWIFHVTAVKTYLNFRHQSLLWPIIAQNACVYTLMCVHICANFWKTSNKFAFELYLQGVFVAQVPC